MPESTLSLKLEDLKAEVGHFLGYGRGSSTNYAETAWTTQQEGAIVSAVKSGLRQFYFPEPIDGQEAAYEWSFLKPIVQLTLASGSQLLDLPADFGGVEGEVTVSQSSGGGFVPIQVRGDVRHLYASTPDATGRPLCCAIEPIRGTTATEGTRFQIRFYPQADAAYTVQFAYYISGDYLDGAFPYHMGGMMHAETVLESCLAVAEERMDDSMSVHAQKFKQRLLASINADRKLKPQLLGYNRDMSDGRMYARDNVHYLGSGVTVNGVLY